MKFGDVKRQEAGPRQGRKEIQRTISSALLQCSSWRRRRRLTMVSILSWLACKQMIKRQASLEIRRGHMMTVLFTMTCLIGSKSPWITSSMIERHHRRASGPKNLLRSGQMHLRLRQSSKRIQCQVTCHEHATTWAYAPRTRQMPGLPTASSQLDAAKRRQESQHARRPFRSRPWIAQPTTRLAEPTTHLALLP